MAKDRRDNDSDVEKYFLHTKNQVSTDWRDLARCLGFKTPNINNIATEHGTDKARCMELLQQWHTLKGNAATIQVLLKSLADANLQRAVDSLKEKYPELHRSQDTKKQTEECDWQERGELSGKRKRKRKRRKKTKQSREESVSSPMVKNGHDGNLNVTETYFDKVVEDVSNKWDHLARKLELSENQIKVLRTSDRYRDDDRRCREVLNGWWNKKGRKATPQVLKQALIDIDERRTAESLGEGVQNICAPQVSTVKRKRKKQDQEPTVAKKLKKSRTEPDSEDESQQTEEEYTAKVFNALVDDSKSVFNDEVLEDPEKFSKAVKAFKRNADTLLRFGVRKRFEAVKVIIKRKIRGEVKRVYVKLFTDEVKRNTDLFDRLSRSFDIFGATLKKIEAGCVLCYLEFENSSCYDTFLSAYKDGRLSETLTRELITDDMMAAEGGDLYLQVILLGMDEQCQDDKGLPGNHVTRSKDIVTSEHDEDDTDSDSSVHESNACFKILEMSEKIFHTATVTDPNKFDKAIKVFQTHAELVIGESGRDSKKPLLDRRVKLKLAKAVNKKVQEVQEMAFTTRILSDLKVYNRIVNCFERFCATLQKVKRGCVLCYLDFDDASCYRTFLAAYRDGRLSETLTRELITDDMRAAEGEDLYVHVTLLGEDGECQDDSLADKEEPRGPTEGRQVESTAPDLPVSIKQEPLYHQGRVKPEVDTLRMKLTEESDPSGTAGRGLPHPGPSREHSGQGPPEPGSSNYGDEMPPGYHGDGTGGQQVSGGDDVIQVKQEPAEQVLSCCMMGTVKSELDTHGIEVKEESELDRQFAAIADHLGSMWERLALYLGFNTDYIRDLTARLPPSLRPHQLICDWMERNVGDVMLEQLVQALRDAGIHEVADAVDSGQLFVTEADYEVAKGKPDGEMDTDWPGSGERLPEDTASESSESSRSHGDVEGGPIAEDDRRTVLDSDEAYSGQLFTTAAEATKEKQDEDMGTGSRGEERSNERLPEDGQTSASEPDRDDDKEGSGNISAGDKTSYNSTISQLKYPTGEDALAWDGCIQVFFKTDEDTTRSIQQSWPSLGSCKRLKKVNLSYNKLSDKGDFLPPLPNLEEIDLSHNDISDEAVPGLVEGLASCQNLEKIDLSWNRLSVRKYILPPLPNLKEIDLSHNVISDEAVSGLSKGLSSCQKLKKVDLSCNKLSDRGDFLPPLPNLEEIDLSNNAISDEAVSGLAEGLCFSLYLKKLNLSHNKLSHRIEFLPTLPNLEEIDLSHNAISDETVPGLAKGLMSCQYLKKVNLGHNKMFERGDFLPPLPNLEEIDLSYNSITDEAVPGLAEGLGSCQNLKKVNLSYNKLSDRGDFLPPLSNLEKIDLSHNYISDVAVPGLAKGFLSCQSLKKVDLSFNKLSDKGDFLLSLPNLKEIDLSGNNISDRAVPDLAEGLASCQNLEKLNLSHNKLSDRGDFLPPLPNLEEIDLSHNAISDEAVSGLTEGLRSCQNLKKVNLGHNKVSNWADVLSVLSIKNESNLGLISIALARNEETLGRTKGLCTGQNMKKMNLSYNKLSYREDFLPPLANLEEIDLSCNAISDEAVSGLAEGLGSCQNLKKVNLSHNKLSDRGDFLPPLPKLEEMDLSNNDISDEAVPGLTKVLCACQNLKKVDLSHNKLSDRGDFLPSLPYLEEIDLSHNAISDKAVPGLAKGFGSCRNLKKVDLSHNKLSERGDFLSPLALEEIDLSHNSINDKAVPGLVKGLATCQGLRTVHLTNNQISNKGALMMLQQESRRKIQFYVLGNNVSRDLTSLISGRQDTDNVGKLDLVSGEYVWSDVTPLSITAIHLLLQFLPQLPNLQELALCVSCQGEEEAEHISQLYGVQHLLKKLKLKEWSLDNIIKLFSQLIRKLPLLEEIDLSRDDINDEAVPGLAECLASSQNLKRVNLSDNKLYDVGKLLQTFIILPTLTHVSIEYNSISDESLPAIAAWLKVRTAMDKVGLCGNCFSAEGVRDFVRTMKGEAYQNGRLLYRDDVQDEAQQWKRLRRETGWICVKIRQLTVTIDHRGSRLNNAK
ncbi:uncharacterized protein LOC118408380 [Branchiostoma floridae]|uniref:Uncharacterized protein LOC118408380 n=1 Tax=Branchiostoma floridae TaxID=7739 RepID=A0A9J7KLG4_BRAFL|nr:uncharacterized protein LOC118408380 [Branchiostoma floridae]